MSQKLLRFNMLRWVTLSTLFLSILTRSTLAELERMEDSELEKLIEHEKYVVVLFTDDESSEQSVELELELSSVREDLVETLNAWVVKAVNAESLKAKYHVHVYHHGHEGVEPLHQPKIVFFRSTVPVLYSGPADEEYMLASFHKFTSSCVQELTDTNFEHNTQASTGATTGDWFVMFVRDECNDCSKALASFESLACKHQGRINVARVNKDGSGAVTARRFEIAETPTLIFFRLGRMYRYDVSKLDVDSMSSFITGWYQNVKAESIPMPKSPFDDFAQLCADYLRDHPFLSAAFVAIPVLLGLGFYFLTKSDDNVGTKRSKSSKAKSSSSKKKKEK